MIPASEHMPDMILFVFLFIFIVDHLIDIFIFQGNELEAFDDFRGIAVFPQDVKADWLQISLVAGIDGAQHTGHGGDIHLGPSKHISAHIPVAQVPAFFQAGDMFFHNFFGILGKFVQIFCCHRTGKINGYGFGLVHTDCSAHCPTDPAAQITSQVRSAKPAADQSPGHGAQAGQDSANRSAHSYILLAAGALIFRYASGHIFVNLTAQLPHPVNDAADLIVRDRVCDHQKGVIPLPAIDLTHPKSQLIQRLQYTSALVTDKGRDSGHRADGMIMVQHIVDLLMTVVLRLVMSYPFHCHARHVGRRRFHHLIQRVLGTHALGGGRDPQVQAGPAAGPLE